MVRGLACPLRTTSLAAVTFESVGEALDVPCGLGSNATAIRCCASAGSSARTNTSGVPRQDHLRRQPPGPDVADQAGTFTAPTFLDEAPVSRAHLRRR